MPVPSGYLEALVPSGDLLQPVSLPHPVSIAGSVGTTSVIKLCVAHLPRFWLPLHQRSLRPSPWLYFGPPGSCLHLGLPLPFRLCPGYSAGHRHHSRSASGGRLPASTTDYAYTSRSSLPLTSSSSSITPLPCLRLSPRQLSARLPGLRCCPVPSAVLFCRFLHSPWFHLQASVRPLSQDSTMDTPCGQLLQAPIHHQRPALFPLLRLPLSRRED